MKREELWLGYKLHVSETCGGQPRGGAAAAAFPDVITHVATTGATVTDNAVTSVIDDSLAVKGLAPGRHYLDSGYLSAAIVAEEARRRGIALIGPLPGDSSAQARAGNGYARAGFAAGYDRQLVTCPQGKTSASWPPCTQRGRDTIVATFSPEDCGPCPARELCTSGSRKRRQLSLLPRELAGVQAASREQEKTLSFRAGYARRAGIEGTMHQAVSHGARRARYRGLSKTRLEHAFMAVALNLIRLHAYWSGNPPTAGGPPTSPAPNSTSPRDPISQQGHLRSQNRAIARLCGLFVGFLQGCARGSGHTGIGRVDAELAG